MNHFIRKQLKKVVNKLKLRASVGRTGNDKTGQERFLYRPTFTTNAGGFTQGIGDTGGTNGIGNGIVEGRFAAPYLAWEIEDKQNYGFDLGLFDNRIDIIFDYFRSERRDYFVTASYCSTIGRASSRPWQNFGKVRNQGIDMSMNLNQQIGKLKLSARGTFTFTRNKILEYDELPQKYGYQAVTGTRVSENTLYIADRLYTEDRFYSQYQC